MMKWEAWYIVILEYENERERDKSRKEDANSFWENYARCDDISFVLSMYHLFINIDWNSICFSQIFFSQFFILL